MENAGVKSSKSKYCRSDQTSNKDKAGRSGKYFGYVLRYQAK